MRLRTSRGVSGLKSRPNGVSPSGRGWAVRRGCPRNHLWFALSSIRAAEFCTCAWRPPRPAQLKTAGASSSREMITPATRTPRIPLRNVLRLIREPPEMGRGAWQGAQAPIQRVDEFDSSYKDKKTRHSNFNFMSLWVSRMTQGRLTWDRPQSRVGYLIRCDAGVVNLIFGL